MHKHHIIPKHEWKERFGNLKGFNHTDNVTLLTVEQHAECHEWLWKQYGRWQDEVAFKFLSNQITAEDAQKMMGRAVGLSNKGRKRSFTAEHIENIRYSMRKPKTWLHRHNISKALKGKRPASIKTGRIVTIETRRKISESKRAYHLLRTVGV